MLREKRLDVSEKKVFLLPAVFLVLLMACVLFPMKAEAGWNGSTYEISTASELVYFKNYVNGGNTGTNAILTCDIDMSSVTGWDGIGVNDSVLYTGTFDGNGFCISNLSGSQGLFAYNGGTVKNIVINDVNIIPQSNDIGMIVGHNKGNVQGCIVSGNIEISDWFISIGGIVGWNDGGTVQGCMCFGTGAGQYYYNLIGLVGTLYGGGALSNCYYSGACEKPIVGSNWGQPEEVYYKSEGSFYKFTTYGGDPDDSEGNKIVEMLNAWSDSNDGHFTYFLNAENEVDYVLSRFSAEADDVTYDGNPHGITITVPGNPEIRYGTSADSCTQTESPAFKDVGKYTVYFQILKGGRVTEDSKEFEIKAKELTISGVNAQDRAYDTTNTVTLTGGTLNGVISGDDVSFSLGNGTLTDAMPGELKSVQTNIVLTGADKKNYSLIQPTNITVNILKASQSAPENIGAAPETVALKKDGKITNVTAAMEYRKDGADSYLSVSGTEITDLEPGKYFVRYKETDCYNASGNTEVEVLSGKKMKVTLPSNQTGYTLSADKESIAWTESATLTFSLAPGYSKTDKFAVKVNGTPVALQADGTYTISKAETDITVTVEGVADITAPDAVITVEKNEWKEFFNGITFGLFFDKATDVTITAEDKDTGSGLKDICYFISVQELSEEQVRALDDADWTEYTDIFSIDDEKNYIIYAKAADNAGNTVYINSDGLVIDKTVPKIMGIENGRTYCISVGFTVDEDYLDKVTVNGTELVPVNGIYTLKAGENEVIVIDKAGNKTPMTVAVNEKHTFRWIVDRKASSSRIGYKHEECSVCGYKKGKVVIPASGSGNVKTENVNTGDNANVIFWLLLMAASTGMVFGIIVYRRKKISNR